MHISMLRRNRKHVEEAGRWNKNGVERFSSSHHFPESLAILLSVEHFNELKRYCGKWANFAQVISL